MSSPASAHLRSIPGDWTTTRVKQLFEERDLRSAEGDEELFSLSKTRGLLPRSEITDKVERADSLKGYKRFLPNDLVMNKMQAWNGVFGFAGEQQGIISPDYAVFRVIANIDPRFFTYLFKTDLYAGVFGQLARGMGTAFLRLNTDDFGGVHVPLPSRSVQSKVANFLDDKAARIDALIAEKERLVEAIDELQRSRLWALVTEGIHAEAPKRESGVEWVGSVPAHWSVTKLKWLTPVLRGASPRPIDDPKFFDIEGEYAWVRIADVSASDGYLVTTQQQLSEQGSSLSVKREPGDLFLSIAGTVGKPCITKIKCCIHDGFVWFPQLGQGLLRDWLFSIFEAGFAYAGLGKMGTQLNLNTDTVGNINIPIPPDAEMREILGEVHAVTAANRFLRAHVVEHIARLREYRSSLISAAVTGQIDVGAYEVAAC